MKIAHVTATFPPYWGGTGNVAYHNARLMHERGHEVTVFTAKTTNDDTILFPFEVRRLRANLRIGNASLTPGLINELRGFDLIHLHYPYILGAEMTLLASKLFRTPLVLTYHNDLLAEGLRGHIFKMYNQLNQRFILRLATILAVTSEDYAVNSQFSKTVSNPRRVQVIPNGVNTAEFYPKPSNGTLAKLNLLESTPIILFVGGLDKAHYFKGVQVLLTALKEETSAHVVLVGDGDLRADYEKQAQKLAPSRVHFMGKVSLNQLIELYSLATVTVLPSVTQGEAFGLVLIESMACCTPVIASDLPGVRTVVSDGKDGFLVTPGNVDSLVATLKELLANPDRAKEMGRWGRKKVEQLYDWEVIGDKIEDVYQKALTGMPTV
jgi:glycosyltransferase involved in cell wall biosynthesis